MLPEEIDDIKLYLRNEGLFDNQIEDFLKSHDLPAMSEDDAWEIVDAHVFTDTDVRIYES